MLDRDPVICKMALIPAAGHAPPRDDDESFLRLSQLGVLAPPFAARIAAGAGLRNRIVREHDEIDPARVHEGLQAAVRDTPEYLQRVHDHLEAGG